MSNDNAVGVAHPLHLALVARNLLLLQCFIRRWQQYILKVVIFGVNLQ
jgi:hypothetical protein